MVRLIEECRIYGVTSGVVICKKCGTKVPYAQRRRGDRFEVQDENDLLAELLICPKCLFVGLLIEFARNYDDNDKYFSNEDIKELKSKYPLIQRYIMFADRIEKEQKQTELSLSLFVISYGIKIGDLLLKEGNFSQSINCYNKAEAAILQKETFGVYLDNAGNNPAAVAKKIRTLTSMGKSKSLELVKNIHSKVFSFKEKAEAEQLKETLKETGAHVKIEKEVDLPDMERHLMDHIQHGKEQAMHVLSNKSS